MTITRPANHDVNDVPWRSSIALTCATLGVPREDWELFARWADDGASPKTVAGLRAYLDVMIADRCRHPTSDLVSHLIHVDAEGIELTVDDVHVLVASLVAGSTVVPPPQDESPVPSSGRGV